MMTQEQVISELNELIKEGEKTVLPTKFYLKDVLFSHAYVDGSIYTGWHTKVLTFLRVFFPEESEYIGKIRKYEQNYYSSASSIISVLNAVIEYLEKGIINIHQPEVFDADEELRIIFKRFHKIVRQLRNRYNCRTTLQINDEYDVQDLLNVLLKLFFDDIRPEEWTPSYAGKSARMDFLLKNEQLVIEVKKTRNCLTDKEIGDQLIVDVERYQAHPDCKKLICFVYDPEGFIGNPDGIMKDLNEKHNGFVEVIIEPNT